MRRRLSAAFFAVIRRGTPSPWCDFKLIDIDSYMAKINGCALGIMVALFTGCTVVPHNAQNVFANTVVRTAPVLPSGYIDIEHFPQDRLALYAVSKWVKQAASDEEVFLRGVRVYADMRKDYFDRIDAGFDKKAARTAVTQQIMERANSQILPDGSKGFGIFVNASYPAYRAYNYAKGVVSITVGNDSYSVRIPQSTAVLDSRVSNSKSFHQNLAAIMDERHFENKNNYSIVEISSLGTEVSTAPISQEAFTQLNYDNSKKNLQTIAKTSGYVLFDIDKCQEIRSSLVCSGKERGHALNDLVLSAEPYRR